MPQVFDWLGVEVMAYAFDHSLLRDVLLANGARMNQLLLVMTPLIFKKCRAATHRVGLRSLEIFYTAELPLPIICLNVRDRRLQSDVSLPRVVRSR